MVNKAAAIGKEMLGQHNIIYKRYTKKDELFPNYVRRLIRAKNI